MLQRFFRGGVFMNFCIGRHVLGDCLEVMRRIPDCTADMILRIL